ncbi:MAG: 23S rRNA (guanosine(2251)-2'-O)-methyltransferase RlmB [Erysipelotrichales bacterium]|nr:23S rRNA (guanosine(2251)-2'-O)-methyltransferase RlmB [Erysipelotrichales bacterium]
MRQYIYGKNTVIEALKGSKPVYQVYMMKNVKDDKIIALAKSKNAKVNIIAQKNVLNDMVGRVVHQGIVAQVEGYDYYEIDEIINHISKGKQPLLLMLDGLEDPHNLGAILRTCDAIEVDGVIIGKNRSVALTPTVAKVSTGAIDYVKVAQVTNLSRTLEDLKKKGFWVVGCDLDNSQDYRAVDYNMPVVIVVGSEGFGISRLVKKHCDMNVILPMTGHVTSLNASVATAVILYQVYNSRHPF